MAEQSQEGRAYIRHEIPMYGGHVISKEIQLSLQGLKNNPSFLYLATVADPIPSGVLLDKTRSFKGLDGVG